jgi:hypothetical protein
MKDPDPGRKLSVVQAESIDSLRGVDTDSQSSSSILIVVKSFPS